MCWAQCCLFLTNLQAPFYYNLHESPDGNECSWWVFVWPFEAEHRPCLFYCNSLQHPAHSCSDCTLIYDASSKVGTLDYYREWNAGESSISGL